MTSPPMARLDVLSDAQLQRLVCSSKLHCCTVGSRLAFQRNPPEPRCRYVVEKRKRKGEGGGLEEAMSGQMDATGSLGAPQPPAPRSRPVHPIRSCPYTRTGWLEGD